MRRTVIAAALLPCALALTSCASSAKSTSRVVTTAGAAADSDGSTNAKLTQAQLTAKIKTALDAATALHMKGTMTDSGQATSMDMQLNKDGSVQGTVEVQGMSMPIISVDGVTYLQFTAGYIKMMEQSAGGGVADSYFTKYENKWISSKSSTGADMTSGLGDVSFDSMSKQMIDNADEKYTYLSTSTLNGTPVALYKDVDKTDGTATVYFPLNGPALPIKLDAGSKGVMTFTWNQPTTITAPPASEVTTFTVPTP
ncbi:hypothetical protein [Actinospica robiniae]|uniref:hypothetical protein n=1 Tax=Actinospica robiniae TaxID=304901 RepID=UPI000422BED7|nr:hypothetical protein [Actinospica robiniae]